jgi:hypothetical protein
MIGGVGFILRLYRFSFTIWFVIGVITIFWANYTREECINMLKKV